MPPRLLTSRPRPFRPAVLRAALAAALLAGGLSACARQETGAVHGRAASGRTAAVSYGTILGTRPVTMRGDGGSPGGVLPGGVAGHAVGSGASSGRAAEFTVREDRGGDFQVLQTDEEGLRDGDRVVISRGDRTRLSRASGGPPPAVPPLVFAPQASLQRPDPAGTAGYPPDPGAATPAAVTQ